MQVAFPKQDPAELRVDEQLFERILRLTPDVVYVYDLMTGRNIFANRQITETLGYPVGALQHLREKVLQTLVHPDDWALVQAHLARLLFAENHDVISCEYRMQHADGSWRALLSRDQPLHRGPDGRVRTILGFATDLTALKHKERLLRESAEQRSILFRAIHESYIALDPGARIIELNDGAVNWLGKPADVLIGRRLSEVLTEGVEVISEIEKACRQRETVHLQFASFKGDETSFEASVYPAEIGAGVVIRDVTDRKRAERSTADAASFLQAAIDALSAHIAVTDQLGTILSVNRAWSEAASLEGRPERLDIGANYASVFRSRAQEVDPPGLRKHLRALFSGATTNFRASFSRAVDGEKRWFQVHANSFLHSNTMRFVFAHEDVTDIKLRDLERQAVANRLLEVQDQERRRIGRELHDSTGQILAGIQIGLLRLKSHLMAGTDSESVLSELKAALKEAQSELRVFSLLLHPPLLENSNFPAVLRQFARSFADRSGLDVKFCCRARLPSLRPDVALALLRITQEALANVHSHAKATHVRIELVKSRDCLLLEIVDDGIGMPRFDNAGKATVGVGLAGMQARARELQGELSIEPAKPGGTTIRATLPLVGISATGTRKG